MNEQKHTMTGAWALNALDAEEREQMRRYLEEDPEAAAEALAFEETASELAGSLSPLTPRPEMKAAVMARIGTTRQLSPLPEQEDPAAGADLAVPAPAAADPVDGRSPAAESTAPTDAPTTAPAADPSAMPSAAPADAPRAEVVPLDRYRASVRRSRWAAIAAGALLVTTIVGAGLWNSERVAEQEARASLEAMASQQAESGQEQAMLSTILSSDDAAHLVVPSQEGGALQLMYSRDQQAMIVHGAGLPALPSGETYQLWMIDDAGGITSAGLLEDPSTGVTHAGAIPEGVTIGLTIEPAGGSEQPTMTPIADEVLS
ncbi:anti-sigma factor domain-containing protein [Brachybacterium sp.]|uniref:anti-sigma factor domain-containing protein n=1 Tax=Brachybacterium sp. TaxID=1891286 RepID=UPI002ED399F0